MARLVDVRADERERFGWFAALAALLAFGQMLGQAGTESLFLARLGAERLPEAFVFASISTVAASLLYAMRVGHARNDRVAVELLGLAVVAIGAGAFALRQGSEIALVALFCLFFATQAVLIGHFWTLLGDFFDTLAAKRVVPLCTVGLSFGGALGGGAALGVVSTLPAEMLLVGWALGLVAAAVLVATSHGRLARWRAVSQGEEDETSVEGLRAAVRYLRGSRLGRRLFVSALTMVLALFVAQYLYSARIAAAFPDEAELARFLAIYLMVSNAVEIGVELFVTPFAIRRLGVPAANLIQPLATLATFVGLGFAPGLPVAVLARANRELLDNALAAPVRTLAANALPDRFRARVRAFLEGIVVYAGMSLAGVVLLLARDLPAESLVLAGAALAGLHFLANLGVRRQYVAAIVGELRAGRFDWHALGDEIGAHEVESLAALWERLVRETPGDPGPALLDLPPLLVRHGLTAPVRTALGHPSPALRAACLAALAAAPEAQADPAFWLRVLGDSDADVRRAALRLLPDALLAGPEVHGALRALRDDADPRVRAAAARRLGAEGEPLFAALLASPDTGNVAAALESLPPALAGAAVARLADPDARLRAAALDALARGGAEASLQPLATSRLADPDARVRRAAVRAVAGTGADAAAIAPALRDPAREVRSEAVRALVEQGDRGAVAARPLLDAGEEFAVGAALRVLGAVGSPWAVASLREHYAARVREAVQAFLCARVFATTDGVPVFVAAAGSDALARALRLAWRSLARIEDERVVRSAERSLRGATGRMRADALEVLSQLGDREASQRLVLLLEPMPVEEKIEALRSWGRVPRDAAEAMTHAAALSSPWIRLAVRRRTDAEEIQMERLLSLRQVSLFAHMSLERLHAVERILRDAEYVQGEVILREHEPGDDLYLLVEGHVDVLRGAGTPGEMLLNRLGPGAYFGEMAVLDGTPRSATIVAAGPVRVLVLEGERLRELVHEMPELAFDLLRVLAERVRRAEERLAAGES
ncbi:MAG: cyclic nucleotide-binding domain-containing protein [Myxococcota bacterium]|nr:cyclic nucleotide-binding domain-containing protein [Myxococcota bacterium]